MRSTLPLTFAAIGVQRVASLAAGLGLHVLCARMIGEDGYGRYAYWLTWVIACAPVAMWGARTAGVRQVSAYLATNEPELAAGFVRWSRQRLALAGSMTAMVALLVLWLTGIIVDPFTAAAWIFALLGFAWFNAESAFLQGADRVVLAQLVHSLARPLLIILSLGVVWWWQLELEATSVLWIDAVACVAVALLAWVTTRRFLPAAPVPAVDVREPWHRGARMLVALSILGAVITEVDVLVIGLVVGDAETGAFFAAKRLVGFMGFALMVVNITVAPRISAAHAREDHAELQRLLRISVGLGTLAAVPVCAGLIIFGDSLLAIFGAAFTRAHGALGWMAVGQLWSVVCGSVVYFLLMTHGEALLIRLYLVVFCCKTAAVALFASSHGIDGAAWGTVVGDVVLNTGAAWVIARRYGRHTSLIAWVVRR